MTRRLLVLVLLALGCLLAPAGSAWAISGLASTGPAAGAQYPDAEAQLPDQRRDVVAARPAPTLVALGAGGVARVGRDRGTARLPDESPGLVERAVSAVGAGPAGGAREYGGVPVLLTAIAALAAASLLRLRRGGPPGGARPA